MSARVREWQSRLAAVVSERMTAPFEWGRNDCCLFAADCVKAMTGRDPAADARGYTDEREAARIIKKLGGLGAIAATRAGGPEIAPMLARIGDVVYGTLGRDCLGICTGETWHAPGEHGLLAAPMSTVKRAWRV
jgi:hypothetical protein